MKKKITIVDKNLNQLVVVADCSSALYQDRGTKLGEQNLLSDTAVTFKVYDGTAQVAVMMADILQVPTKQGTMADIWPTPANPLPDKQLAINYLCARNAERQMLCDKDPKDSVAMVLPITTHLYIDSIKVENAYKRRGIATGIPYMYNKTTDWSYYVLTLIAIAKEMMAMGYVRPGQKQVKQDVCLAMGLPPTHIHDLASEYDKYFGRDGRRVVFTYNNVDFEVRIVRVMVFPQGVAAIAPYMSKIMARPEAYTYIIDIGGYTTDVVKFSRGGQVDMAFCESFNNGVIKMYDEVQRAVRNRFQLDVDDYTIDNILRCGYNPGKELNDVVHTTAQNYARTLIRSLKEKGVDLTLSYPVFIGGGSILMRPVIESELGRDDYLFIDDPRANAVGYKMMAESRLAAESR